MKHIFYTFDEEAILAGCHNGQSNVVGVSTLNGNPRITANEVKFSRGEFAGYFVEDGRLFLFRDRLGARNIYYMRDGEKIHVSTDMLMLISLKKQKMNETYKEEYLQYQIPLGRLTMYLGIQKVLPATIYDVTNDKEEKYWTIRFGNEKFDAEKLRQLIIDAVEFRKSLIDMDKTTAYLSGGLDSSAMTILSGVKVAYSGFYKDKEYSELDYIKEVASHCSLAMDNNVEIKEKKFYEYLEKLFKVLPSPCCGLGIIAQMIVADSAKENSYAFTGEGGDEVFLGYNWNTMIVEMARQLSRLKRDIYMVGYEGLIDEAIRNGFKGWTEGILNRAAQPFKNESTELPWNHGESVINNIHRINLEMGLPAILTVDEAVGYYSGVEPVSPLIDHNIVEYVCSVNEIERSFLPKHLFREAMRGILPEKIRCRTDKMGFPIPVGKWLWPMLREKLEWLKVNDSDFAGLRIGSEPPKMSRWAWSLFNIANVEMELSNGNHNFK